MDEFGFIKICAAVPKVKIADIHFNVGEISRLMLKAAEEQVKVLVFPELSLTGYTCGDLFMQDLLLAKAEDGVIRLCQEISSTDILTAVGAPVRFRGRLFNCAIIICDGEVKGIVPKSFIPNYNEFYEKRWFESGANITNETINFAAFEVPFGTDLIFNYEGVRMGVEICEDLWVPEPPSGKLAKAGAEIILNLSASDELIGKHDYLLSLLSQQSARCRCAYAYASAGWGESSTDLVFSGNAIIADDGSLTESSERFAPGEYFTTKWIDIQKLRNERLKFNSFFSKPDAASGYRNILCKAENTHTKTLFPDVSPDPHPFVPEEPEELDERCREIFNIQAYGLMKRLDAIGCKKAVVGISGGLDSTLALLVTVKAFDNLGFPRSGIIGVTMPGMATTSRTKGNAWNLMQQLGVTSLEIPIGEAVEQHFSDIGQDPKKYDATYENSQARERTQILMDLANKENGIVIGTGDMSELALGWCTYNGDHISMYGVNASVPKTLVRHLVEWTAKQSAEDIARTLNDIADTPISPELVPSGRDEISQKTEDLVGPYELHDFFLYHFLRNGFPPKKIYYLAVKAFDGKFDKATILKWLKTFYRRFFSQQFKRSCMPDGPKVGSVSLSPRGDWRMPSDACVKLWLDDLEKI